MSRRRWFDHEGAMPFGGSIARLQSWQDAIEDGVIEPHEVAAQTERVLGLLRDLEPLLDDDVHERVTRVLEEWAVLQAMQGTLLVEEFGRGASSTRDTP
ncbi:MAG: hypothetical protein JST00_09100 [Deltaproteobacteria bacterium]|nr:hypothetical protein [Deltaproteobacteria bacterium]